jgi:alpha-tubulin suppressor-like RCC1 family protein
MLGDNTTTNRLVPTLVYGGNTFSDLTIGTLHTCGLLTSGGVKCWGSNTYNWNPLGGVGDGSIAGTSTSQPQTVLDTETYVKISAGWNTTCGITTSNKVKCWGEINRGFLGDPSSNIRLTPDVSDLGELYQSVATGGANCGITTAGILKCWGGDYSTPYPTGDGTSIFRTSPVVIDRGRVYKAISSGGSHRCGIRSDDSLYCWGDNSKGQVGVGGSSVSLPMKVDSGTKYLQVSAGSQYTCGITTGNVLKCWGDNTNYKLGDNTSTSRPNPIVIDSGTLYKKVDTGSGSWTGGCGITIDDHIKCWGYNYYGAVGDGTTTTSRVPVPIMSSTIFTEISVGSDYACAITDAKALYCWGTGSDNRLGTGTTTQQNSPVLIASGTQFDTVTAGSTSSCAIRSSDKRVMCWGTNGPFGVLTGALGNNNTAASTPALTSDTDSYISLSSPGTSVCGVTTNNVLKCWGHNRYGGLANDSVFRMWGTPVDITPWINP